MAQEHVEIVRGIYEGTVNFLPLLDPGVQWINPSHAIEPGTREGVDEVVDAFQKGAESFESARFEVREMFDGGETIVASLTAYATARGSEVEVSQPEFHSWTFRDGKIISFEWGRDLVGALEAAGISSPPGA